MDRPLVTVDALTLARAYDRSAEGYDERFAALQRPKFEAGARLLDRWLARALLPAGARALDAGAGTGLLAAWLREGPGGAGAGALRTLVDGGRLLALDASGQMLLRARARGLPCLRADLARPPFAAGAFALVLSFTSLLGDPAPGLRALASLVAPGGALLVTLLARDWPGAGALASASGLFALAEEAAAGQDHACLLVRPPWGGEEPGR